MKKQRKTETKTKNDIANEIKQRFKYNDDEIVLVYQRGFVDFARFIQAGGTWPEIKEMLQQRQVFTIK